MDNFENSFGIWVDKLIDDHQNPQVKDDLEKEKQDEETSDDALEIANRLEYLKTQITSERVELLNLRSLGDWIPAKRLILIGQQTGSKICSMGFQNIEGKFLFPFEALYLLETNRLEVFENQIPWSLGKAYSVLLNDTNCMEMYKGYRKLALFGFDIKSKCCLEEIHDAKRICLRGPDTVILDSNLKDDKKTLLYEDIFRNLKEQGPKYDAISMRNEGNDMKWCFRSDNEEAYENYDFITNNEIHREQFFSQKGSQVYHIGGSIIEIEAVETMDVPYTNS